MKAASMNIDRKERHQKWDKAGKREYGKRYRAMHREELKAKKAIAYRKMLSAMTEGERILYNKRNSARQRRGYRRNRNKILARLAALSAKGREARRQASARYTERNRVKINARRRLYYRLNRSQERQRQKDWCKRNKKRVLTWAAEYRKKNRRQILLRDKMRIARVSISYARHLLSHHSNIPSTMIPDSLAELKRQQLLLRRGLAKKAH